MSLSLIYIYINGLFTLGTLVFITCKAYTKNMVYHQTYGLGQTRFELISD